MILVIDCFKLVKGVGKSIGIYNLAKSITFHLGERIVKKKETDKIIVLGNPYNKEDFDVPGVTFVSMKGNPLNKIYCILWELLIVPWYARKYKADRVLFPRGFSPLRCFTGKGHIKCTIIVHDLIPFLYHEQYRNICNPLENAYIRYRLKASVRNADRVITISEFSKNDIIKRVRNCEQKITVIYNGLNDVKFDKTVDHTNQDTNLNIENQDYMIAMTSELPHKNPSGILRAYNQYIRYAKPPLPLIIVGIDSHKTFPSLSEEASEKIIFMKYVKKFDDLCRLVAGAKAYLFLSYMEGFGFPPLEAMQLGVPVVCSNNSSLPEVVGDAALLVDPDRSEQVVDALLAVTTETAVREDLIQKGYRNVERFSWDSRTDLYWKELFL